MSKLNEVIKKIGTTDRYLIGASIVIGVFIFCCLAIFTFTEKDPIAYMLSAIGVLGTLIGFVVNKNKEENKIKINKSKSEVTEPDPE